MMSLTFGLFTQVSGSGPLGPLVSTKKISVFGYKVLKHFTSSPLNKLIKLTMPLTTGPRFVFFL